jgi:hypothetical protein
MGGYGVLARPAVPADAMSDQRVPVAKLAQSMKIDPTGARVVSKTPTETVALVPRADGKLCLHIVRADGFAGGACPDTASATSDGVAAGPPGSQVGVVPDGVKQITFELTDGTTTTAAVRANVYHAPAEAISATFSLGGGQRRVNLTPKSALDRLMNVTPNDTAPQP